MNSTEKFQIQLEKPWVWEGLAPPDNPLGELSDFEMGLRHFCFECNHRVSMEIGDEKVAVFFDPDIMLILDSLPKKITELSCGKTIQIELPESYREIELMPIGSEIRCTLSQFGKVAKRKHFLLERTQVLDVLKGFLSELVRLAVDGGYISPVQGDEFLMEARTNAPLCRFEHQGLPKASIHPSAVHNG